MSDKRRVLVLGNGFDLAVGRKTTYKDFYNSRYCPRTYPAPFIEFLSKQFGDNLDNIGWYDVENAMQQYAIYALKEPDREDYFTKDELKLIKYFLNIDQEAARWGRDYISRIEDGLIKKHKCERNGSKIDTAIQISTIHIWKV